MKERKIKDPSEQMNLVLSVNLTLGACTSPWCFYLRPWPRNLQSFNTSIHLSSRSLIHPQISPHIHLLTYPHSSMSICLPLPILVCPSAYQSIHPSFLPLCSSTPQEATSTCVTEINEVEFLFFFKTFIHHQVRS